MFRTSVGAVNPRYDSHAQSAKGSIPASLPIRLARREERLSEQTYFGRLWVGREWKLACLDLSLLQNVPE